MRITPSRSLALALIAVLALPVAGCAGRGGLKKGDVPYVARDVGTLYSLARKRLDQHQYKEAAVLFDEVERAAQAGDAARVERALADIKDKFGGTTYAAHAGLRGARFFDEQGKTAETKAALAWVAEKAPNDGLRAVARLRLASVQLGEKAYDEALRTLEAGFPPSFVALAADRRGDILLAKGQRAEALAAYQQAWKGLDEGADYRRLVEAKLVSLGAAPEGGTPAAAAEGASK